MKIFILKLFALSSLVSLHAQADYATLECRLDHALSGSPTWVSKIFTLGEHSDKCWTSCQLNHSGVLTGFQDEKIDFTAQIYPTANQYSLELQTTLHQLPTSRSLKAIISGASELQGPCLSGSIHDSSHTLTCRYCRID